jgi:F-type H+-transporting ATPase subunit a
LSLTKKPIRMVILIGILIAVGWAFVNGAIGVVFFGGEPFLEKPHVSLIPHALATSGLELGGATQAFAITNTLLSSWITTFVLIAIFFLATRNMSMVPKGIQNLMEFAVESLYNFVISVAGAEYGKKFFPLIATILFFVLFNAWLALIPIYQSLAYVSNDGNVVAHFLKPAGTDVNMPLALGLISFVYFEFWGFKAHGIRYLGEFFRFGQLLKGDIGMGLVDVFVGILEFFSHIIRMISLTFRLFGNMTAGEILLLVAGFLMAFGAPLPFYGLELLVGFVQALIFAGLTLVFAVVAVASHEGEEH